ncbi:aldose epimerase family protein [Zobellia galactanivorans]|uniref:aldose epimerase family protein n=1 Tax=Zobellia galactanivorans (strain DSM 12802 / CCUG 47099 / CIP 106680 / NCIMB 13871 / Dsij) TaxID=63186 RepID=UPI0026E2E0F4|nr:aldose epimerase family protein [Zobellia galactanivorans]MDO6809634.1 aldose epimerase family protein [Zobellia galactanivorans]
MKSYMYAVLICLCSIARLNSQHAGVKSEKWGVAQGKEVLLYTLTNENGMVVKITDFGGTITAIRVADKEGFFEDVVLGFDNLEQYKAEHPCFGATIGRVANRIRNARFEIDGTPYQLAQNSNGHCLHGGNEFDRVVWQSKIVANELGPSVQLHHLSKEGTMGFPGNLDSYVTYTLTDDDSIHVHYEATTDKATHVNMTQHSYFNLNGGKDKIYDHIIKIDADNYTEIDEEIIPTGNLATVKGTDWDLTSPTPIGKNIHKLNFNGYHYNYVFNKPNGELKEVIQVVEPKSGRTLSVFTTQPGVQFYSGNTIGDTFTGKNDIRYSDHMAFCLETQHFPDTPNHPSFPSTLLLPGEKYDETTIFRFGVEE